MINSARILDVHIRINGRHDFLLGANVEADPGQFIMVWTPETEAKPFFIASDSPLTFKIHPVGPVTNNICSLTAGERIWWYGPFGNGFDIKSYQKIIIAEIHKNAVYLSPALQFLNFRLHRIMPYSYTVKFGIHNILESCKFEQKPDLICTSGSITEMKMLREFCYQQRIALKAVLLGHIRCAMGICGSCEILNNLVPYGMLACKDGPVFTYNDEFF